MAPVSTSDFLSSEFDYLVLGAGTAGLAVAARLSEDPNVRVGVIEAGELVVDRPEVNIPGMVGRAVGSDLDWKFETIPQENANNRVIRQPRGKVVGGTSALNFEAWGRASAAEYDAYEVLGNEGWNWPEFLKYLKKAETFTPPPPEIAKQHHVNYEAQYHGTDGPIQMTFPVWFNDLHLPFLEASAARGIPYNSDNGDGKNNGSFTGTFCIDPRTGTRSYSTTGYYLPNAERKNLVLLTGAHITRILFEDTQGSDVVATGVEFLKDGQTLVAKAKREVVLCAGTHQTPQILELSGIGKSEILKKHGIKQIVDLPVGEGLQDHVWVHFIFEISKDIFTLESLRESPEVLGEIMRTYKEEKKGMMASVFSAYSFAPLSSVMTPSELEAHGNEIVNGDSFSKTPFGRKYASLYKDWAHDDGHAQLEVLQTPGFLTRVDLKPKPDTHYNTFMAGLLQPLSRGSVHIGSSDPLAPPVIDPAFLKNPLDLKLLVKIVKLCRDIMNSDAYKAANPVAYDPPNEMQSDEELEEFVRKTANPFFHPVGTASMLPKEDGGVVDKTLKVYGTKNLRVVDASVMPFVLSCHIQSTIYAIAEKAADIIKAANA
ncbi:alcohol oxidase [Stereum hirsutum FP-91666 SS1]|uniref:alcohol oxidase n=1 Tax=Stereum hirsutum (strain FP-91666) TaxID=721885 RepID=UPI000440C773|nr:alcohol oxidase [Stereum hirsutum FP-91666 SS1]EIM88948.1 alcohol oxidase [Stereum hirsutum FP-91666 SS1]